MTSTLRVALTLLTFTFLAGEARGQSVPRPPRKGTKYTIKIDSSPQQTAIWLDDKQYGIVGYTPYTGKLVKGDYVLILELPGFKPVSRQIRVDSSSHEFFIPMEKQILPGTIDVQAAADPNVMGAQVFIDGQLQGTAPNAVEVPEGRHLLEIKKTGFSDYAQWVSVKQGEHVTITPVVKAAVSKGSLLIDADVQGAKVSVDGLPQGDTAPVLVDNLDEGPHIVEVRKDPAPPWKQTVYVKPGQRAKVTAELQANLTAASGGSIRVISSVDGAEVWLDGIDKGKAPQDLTGLNAGVHLVEVKAPGFDTREEKLTVTAGQSTVLKIDPGKVSGAKIHVVSPVPEARVFIDGASVGTVPVDKEITPGEHFVVVQKEGYAKFEQKLMVEAGRPVEVSAELRAAGGLRIMANTEQADVYLDGQNAGKTPLSRDAVDVGEHVIQVKKLGFMDYQGQVTIEGGKTAVVDAQLTALDTETKIRTGLTSFGARTMPNGRFSVDVAAGYPYWFELRSTVGVKDEQAYGADVTVAFRTYGTTFEFLLGSRFRFYQEQTFGLAAFANVGGGGGLAGRNEFTLQGGLIASITFNELMTISGRAFLDVWSDRLCSQPEAPSLVSSSGPDVCTGMAPPADLAKATSLTGSDFYDRDTGARGYISLVVEAAVQKYVGFFLIFEGAPLQSERAAHSNLFNGTLISRDDPIYNGKIGMTFKF